MKREDIYKAIDAERVRQEELHPGWPWDHGTADLSDPLVSDSLNVDRQDVLDEELNEVWSADTQEALCEELIHVASVCCRWLESME